MEQWKKKAWKFQQKMHQKIGNRCWDVSENNEIITNKINQALAICYGDKYQDDKKFKKIFIDVNKKVLSYYNGSYQNCFSCTFLNLWLNDGGDEGIYCVFWLQKGVSGTSVCIDIDCRTYENWQLFIENNLLPECSIMYPRGGKYALNYGEEFEEYKDIMLEKSNACSSWKRTKKFCGELASVVTVYAAFGGLIFNPICAPVVIGTIVGGAVNTLCAADKLRDHHQHEGINVAEAKSVLAVADVVCSAVGTAAYSVAAGKIFSKRGALALNISSTTATVCTVVCGVNFSRFIIEMIYKLKTDSLDESDYRRLQLLLLFESNFQVGRTQLVKLMQNVKHSNFNDIITTTMKIKSRLVELGVWVFAVNKFHDLLDRLLSVKLNEIYHDIIKPLYYQLDELPERDLQNPFKMMKVIISNLPSIFRSLNKIYRESQEKKRNTSTNNEIQESTSSDWLDWRDRIELSSYDSKKNTSIDIDNKIIETLKYLTGSNGEEDLSQNFIKYGELGLLLRMVSTHPMERYPSIINKVYCYCDIFKNIFSKIKELHNFEYFLFTTENGFLNDRNVFFKPMVTLGNILATLLYEFLRLYLDDSRFTYERDAPELHSASIKLIDIFYKPKYLRNEKFYYDTAAMYNMPSSALKETWFENQSDSLVIMKSCDTNFKLLFYSYESDGLVISLGKD